MHKTCCFDLDIFLTFLQGHKNLRFFHTYHERGSLCGHINSLNRLTLTFNHGFTVSNDDVVHKTCLKGHKQLRFFPLCTMDARLSAGGFDSVGVTLLSLYMQFSRLTEERFQRVQNLLII